MEVLLERIERRTTNAYGKDVAERDLILRDLGEIEPLLCRTCTHELDATQPIDEIVEQLVSTGRDPAAGI